MSLLLLGFVPLVLDVVLHAACALFFLDSPLRSVPAWLAPLRSLVELVAYVVLRSMQSDSLSCDRGCPESLWWRWPLSVATVKARHCRLNQ